MTTLTPAASAVDVLRETLDPVRRALLYDVTANAEQVIAEAAADAEAVVEQAQHEVATEIERAEHRGEMSARARADQELARARAEANRDILDAKESIRCQLVGTLHAAALGLRDDPRYPCLLDELERLARRQLGPDAVVDRDPEGLGGIVATVVGRRVDYTLPQLSDRALNTLADEVAQLWA